MTYVLLKLILSFAIISACSHKNAENKAGRSFYYWKSVLKLTAFELNRLDSLEVKTIYLKFFDVDWEVSQSVPKAKLHIKDNRILAKYHIIPTVFITNNCILQTDSSQIKLLAGKIYALIKEICETDHINNIDEIQVDCDWTASSRQKYFSLLQCLKDLSKHNISATIRLHQIKFYSKSGVPPVDRGLLMCYNMGNLKSAATKNSIIETNELIKYTGNLSSYPLPLDIALPIFGWKVLFRNNIYEGLIENIPDDIFTNAFSLKNGARIELSKDSLLAGYDLKKGDVLRSEESSITEILAAVNEINKHLKNTPRRVSLYHLDSVTLNKFTTNELESIYNNFH